MHKPKKIIVVNKNFLLGGEVVKSLRSTLSGVITQEGNMAKELTTRQMLIH